MPRFISRKRLLRSLVDGGCFPEMSSETKRFDLTGDPLYLILPKNLVGVSATSSFLLRLRHQHKQLALELSELNNIAYVIGECRYYHSGQCVGAFSCASSRLH